MTVTVEDPDEEPGEDPEEAPDDTSDDAADEVDDDAAVVTGDPQTQGRRGVARVARDHPEQVRGEPLGPGSDQWAMACVVFEMLTGTKPYSGQSEIDVASSGISKSRRLGTAADWR